ncbi:MAG: fibronectin type III domain-containing protein, partial [Rhodoferax sp.]
NNGSAITGFTVTSIPAGGVDSNAGSTSLTHSITGLVNGMAYTFTVTATNGVGTSSASADSNSVTPVAPVVHPTPTPTPTIPTLSFNISGISGLPAIIDMSRGEGPSFMAGLVQALSNALGMPLQFVGQNATGSVVLSGYNGGNLVFMPLSFQTGDSRSNGVYTIGNGQYQVVVNGQSISIAPAMVRLDQLLASLPGIAASVADTGVITATLNGTTYVVQPGVAVQLNPPTGQQSLVLGADGMYRFTDALGNTQVLYPAFAAPGILRNVLQSIDPTATMNIALDATASIVLGGVHYTLVPDITLGGVPAEQLGKTYWTDGTIRYRMWVSIGQSHGLTVRP